MKDFSKLTSAEKARLMKDVLLGKARLIDKSTETTNRIFYEEVRKDENKCK